MKKVKKILKYTLNSLAIINMLLIGLTPIWGWSIEPVIATIAVVVGLESAILLWAKGKEVQKAKKVREEHFYE